MQYTIKYFDDAALDWFTILVQQLYTPTEIPLVNNHINKAFFYKTIIVFNNAQPCAYCVVYNNAQLQLKQQTCIAIGNWQCINNNAVADLLLTKCNAIAKKLNASYLVGPMHGSTWDNYRFNISNTNALFLGETPQQNYYLQQWQNSNFKICAKYESTIDTNLRLYKPLKMEHYKKVLYDNGITIRNINLQKFETEIENIFDFCAKSFANNFLYTSISKADFIEKYIMLKKYLSANYIFIAEKNTTVVAFLFAYPDALCGLRKQIILKTIANAPTKQTAGLAYVLGNMLIDKCIENNYTSIVHAYMHVSNKSKLSSTNYCTALLREYVLLSKNVL